MLWVLADTETTGLDTDPTARMCEVAYMIVDDDLNVVRSGGGVINPGCRIPPATSAVHGLTDRDVADAPSADEYFWSEFGNGLKESEVCLIAHNAKFDAHFRRPHLAGEFHIMCTLKLARTLYPDLENHKLGTIKYTFGLAEGEDRFHSADGDTNVLLDFVRHIRDEFGYSMYELLELATKPMVVTHMPWGKHKGVSLQEMKARHPGYLKWVMGLDNLDDDLRASIQAL